MSRIVQCGFQEKQSLQEHSVNLGHVLMESAGAHLHLAERHVREVLLSCLGCLQSFLGAQVRQELVLLLCDRKHLRFSSTLDVSN